MLRTLQTKIAGGKSQIMGNAQYAAGPPGGALARYGGTLSCTNVLIEYLNMIRGRAVLRSSI